MCFSASASFIASGVLGGIGLASIALVRLKKLVAIACIPLLFAIQQFAEGVVWVDASPIAATIFLFFALIVWPFYTPFALLMAESDNGKRASLYLLTIIGLGLSLCLLFGLLSSDVSFYIQDCHIVYDAARILLINDRVSLFLGSIYCLVTIIPFFISSQQYIKQIGLLIMGTCLIAYLFYTIYFISVWCFFAALTSTAMLVIVRNNNRIT